ncbi:MAG: SusC/RagA family TonB-linked outer membrane protein, partial [Chitinophagales bacterium]|nr:SusC/RagA family TonB-linked outer membrane protein [Chitinophagales bacterium]
DITFLKDFVFRSSYGFDASFSKIKVFTPAFFISSSQSNALNDLSESISNFNKWLWENTVSYNKEIGKHRMNVLAGYTAQRNTIEYVTTGIQNLIGEDPALWYLQTGDIQYLTASNKSQYGNEPEITALLSYLGRVNYTFNNRYLFTASVRRDGSSKFGANNQWGVFPSVAVGWNIINEAFMTSSDIFSNLKIRASWGIIGNEKIFYLRQFSLVTNNQNAVFGSGEDLVQGSTYGSTGNPDLKWESTTQTDIGLELGLFNDKLTGEFDFYNKITDGILVDLITPGHLGNGPFATQTFNAAKVLNRGFEFNLAWNHQVGKVRYRVGFLGSPVHNEVLELGAAEGIGSFIASGSLGNGQLVTRTVVGESIGSFYGYEVIGVFQNEAELTSSATIAGQQVGDLKYADLNGDGIIDDLDRTFIGSYIPDFSYGFNANVSYDNFSISIDFSGQYGNEIYNGKNAVRPDLYNFEGVVVDHWDGEGSSNTEPRPTSGGTNYEPSDYFIQDGSFLRLRSTTIAYAFPVKLLTDMKITKANVYIRGTNLITFSDYTGYTPEIAAETALASGIDLGVYPITSVYSIGIDLTF